MPIETRENNVCESLGHHQVYTVASTVPGGNALLPTALFRLETPSGASHIFRALCDTGAQVSLVTAECVRKLKLPVRRSQICLAGVDDSGLVESKGVVRLNLKHARGGEKLKVNASMVVVSSILCDQPSTAFDAHDYNELSLCELADPAYNEPSRIDALFGVGVMADILEGGIKKLSNGLIAQKTKLGYTIFGGEAKSDHIYNCMAVVDTTDELNANLRKLWEIEQFDEPIDMKPEDKWCEEHFDATVRRNENGRYVVTIPIRPGNENLLGQSRDVALRRMLALERQFKMDRDYKNWYIQYMRDLIQSEFIQLADSPVDTSVPHVFLPHHGIRPPKKPRVVFDASAPTSTGVSYNSIQCAGPRLQNKLEDILIEFRVGRIAMTADIHKMFPQVEVSRDQWNFQRILWRESSDERICEYVIPRVLFGATSSTYNAVKAMRRCAEDHKEKYPLAYDAIMSSFYVDDFIMSVASERKAVATREQLEACLSEGCFPLSKWVSNCEAVLLEREFPTTKDLSEEDSSSVLGLQWNPREDILYFNIENAVTTGVERITKRWISSEAAKIYDPNGILAPFTIRAKWFIQNLWRTGTSWNDAVPAEVDHAWRQYRAEIKKLHELKIPRWLGIEPEFNISLHVFCDASIKAYCAAAYVRIVDKDGKVKVMFVTSKNKLASLNPETLPRLELSGALIGAKLAVQLAERFKLSKESIYYWTDSQIVLHWLQKFPSTLKLYVGNRVQAIQARSDVQRWAHVPSESNPADLLTRGMTSEELIRSKLWWNGPTFLSETEERWPKWSMQVSDNHQQSADSEVRKVNKVQKKPYVLALRVKSNRPSADLMNLMRDRSSLNSTLRVTAYIQRFLRLFVLTWRGKRAKKSCTGGGVSKKHVLAVRKRKEQTITEQNAKKQRMSPIEQGPEPMPDTDPKIAKILENVPIISHEEYSDALMYWIRVIQRTVFASEYSRLLKGEAVPKNSRIYEYVPFIDRDGIIRLSGRLDRAEMTYDQRHPIVLTGQCILSKRLMEDAHRTMRHAGVQTCMQYLRDKYWILDLRKSMRFVIHKCIRCVLFKAVGSKQLMADLPEPRVRQPLRPFYHCGADLAGPFKVRPYAGRNVPTSRSAYLVIFIDMATKAVHLELVSDLTTQSFLAALDRMIARRGMVKYLYTDNAKNFVGAEAELKLLAEQWFKTDFQCEVAKRQIEFRFTTPRASHMAGIWEANIKRAKFHFYREFGANSFTFEELYTAFVRIEACMNSRPLTVLSDDPNDNTAITPAHFLTGGQIVRPLGPLVQGIPLQRLNNWEKIHAVEQRFWDRFYNEYLYELQRRNIWCEPERNIEVGDLVFLMDENLPPTVWKRARVVKVYPGKDGRVRSVRIVANGKFYDRPIVKLCRIPLEKMIAELDSEYIEDLHEAEGESQRPNGCK